MRFRSSPRGSYLPFILIAATTLSGQSGGNQPFAAGQLQEHYQTAQELQQAGKLNDAAEQYREFLADALGELAIGYSAARDYTHAAPLFDEALILRPNSASLLLDYARTALTLSEPEHARTLATEYIQRYPDNRALLAEAHQVLGRALLKLNRDQEARKELEAALALDPTFANGYDLAVACLDLNDEKCAVQIFGEMQTSFGDTAPLHMAFGRAYSESDFQPRAITEFRQAIKENPRLPGAHYSLAAVLLATGSDDSRTADAETNLKEELVISPRDFASYAALGKIAVIRGHYPDAEAYLKKAIQLGPSNPDAYLYLGQTYFETNRLSDAELVLRQSIRLTTDVSRNRYQVQKAHFLLGRILMKKGQQDEAHKEMLIARDLANKTLSQDKSKMASLLDAPGGHDGPAYGAESENTSSLEIKEADPALRRKVEGRRQQLAPALADSYNNLGVIAAVEGRYKDAVISFERAAVWSPSLEGLDYNWGRAAFAGSQFADAILPLSRYLKLHPDDTGARSVLAISQFMTGNYRDCIETLGPVVGKSELVPQAQYVFAESLVRTGQSDSGIEGLEGLEKLHPEIPDVHRSLGEALASKGRKEQATAELRTAVQLSPRDAESHYALGKMELESGQTEPAVTDLEAAVHLSPNNEQFHQELASAYAASSRNDDAAREREICNALRTHNSLQ